MEAATEIRLAETRRLGRLVGWRIPGVEASQTYHELFRDVPFTVLDESEHGLVSRPRAAGSGRSRATTRSSTGRRRSRPGTSPGTVRVAFAHWVRPLGRRRAELLSEARVQPVDTSRGCG